MSTSSGSFNGSATKVTPSGFRVRRSHATLTGFQPSVDASVASRLEELDDLLGRPVVPSRRSAAKNLVTAPLTPRRVYPEPITQPAPQGGTTRAAVSVPSSPPDDWAAGSLAVKFRDLPQNAGDRTLTDYIDGDADLANLSYAFDELLDEEWNELDFNIRTVLEHGNLRRLLVLRGHIGLNITQPTSLMNFVRNHVMGARSFVDYGVVSAARDYVEANQLRVKDINDDKSEAVEALLEAGLSFSASSFGDEALDALTDYTHDAKYEYLIAQGNVDPDLIPAWVKPKLIEYIKTSVVKVTPANAQYWIPTYVAKAAATGGVTTGGTGGASSSDPFAVEFFMEDSASLQVSTAAVKCASQLYYVMVLGDELGVFDAVRYFTHRYLFREGFAVEDPQLRRDLENYVFSEQFPGHDELTGESRIMSCTRPAERRSFYRQVFDQGREPVPGDGVPNADFSRLWKILMLESARFLEKAQSSPHPDNYVSRQNVMQAVEDLQYNLSTSCVGMSTVMTPLMYAELDFVIKRILNHEEVRRHLVPAGGSWWKVVEKLQAGQGRRGRASVTHNKARIGYSLLRAVAEYTPARFEEDEVFSNFISNVDAFITTQSILQEEARSTDEEHGDADTAESDESGWDDYRDDEREQYGSGYGAGNGQGGGYGGGGYGGGAPGMPDVSNLPGMPSIPGVNAPWPGTGPGGGAGGPAPAGAGSGVGSGTNGQSADWDF
jgi:hypothetical protein